MRRRYSLVRVLLEADELEKVPESSMQAQLKRAQSVMKVLLPMVVRSFNDLYTADEMKKFIEYFPFVSPPPNEVAATPSGMPPIAGGTLAPQSENRQN
jgi:hypothetical protein